MLRYVVRMQTVIRRQQRNCQQRLKLLTMPKLLRISAAEPLFASIKAWLTLMPRLATCRFCAHEYREIVNKIQRIAAAAAVACRKPHRLFCLRSVKNNKNNKKCGKRKTKNFREICRKCTVKAWSRLKSPHSWCISFTITFPPTI